MEEFTGAFKSAYSKAKSDIKKGDYFTADIMLCSMPIIFVVLLFIILAVPVGDPVPRKLPAREEAANKSD